MDFTPTEGELNSESSYALFLIFESFKRIKKVRKHIKRRLAQSQPSFYYLNSLYKTI